MGIGGKLATSARNLPDRSLDTVAVMQARQPQRRLRAGQDLLRVLEVWSADLAEITLSPKLQMKAENDVHIEAWIDNVFSSIGWSFDQSFSPAYLSTA